MYAICRGAVGPLCPAPDPPLIPHSLPLDFIGVRKLGHRMALRPFTSMPGPPEVFHRIKVLGNCIQSTAPCGGVQAVHSEGKCIIGNLTNFGMFWAFSVIFIGRKPGKNPYFSYEIIFYERIYLKNEIVFVTKILRKYYSPKSPPKYRKSIRWIAE